MALILTVLVIFLLLVANEFYWRSHASHDEFSRKFIHITVGSFVATWPFFLSWGEIQLLSLAFLAVVLLSQYFKLFQAIHAVQRPTWGELFFAASVGLIALLTHDKYIYAAALLQMSLADGMAAVIGVKYGNPLKYSVFGHAKSVAGTLTFFFVSVAILTGFSYYGPMSLGVGWIIGISAIGSLVENIAIKGFDNLAVPLLVALLLINH